MVKTNLEPNKLLSEVAHLLQETRRVYNWPKVDKRGFFWFANSSSWDGAERIGLWIDEAVVVFEFSTWEGQGSGSAPVSMFNIEYVGKGGKVQTYRMLRELKSRLSDLYDVCMDKLSLL